MYIYVYIQLGVYFKFKEYFEKANLEKKLDTLFTPPPQKKNMVRHFKHCIILKG